MTREIDNIVDNTNFINEYPSKFELKREEKETQLENNQKKPAIDIVYSKTEERTQKLKESMENHSVIKSNTKDLNESTRQNNVILNTPVEPEKNNLKTSESIKHSHVIVNSQKEREDLKPNQVFVNTINDTHKAKEVLKANIDFQKRKGILEQKFRNQKSIKIKEETNFPSISSRIKEVEKHFKTDQLRNNEDDDKGL